MDKKTKPRTGKKSDNPLENVAYKAGQELGERLNHITAEGNDIIDHVLEEIRAKPVKAALYSVLAGFLIGRLL